jgi:predicted acetyltransferase
MDSALPRDLRTPGLEITRCSSRTQLEAVVDLCARAFPATEREYFERHTMRDATLRPEHTLIGSLDGRIVSSVQIFPRLCRFTGEVVPFGGIGNVATDPEARGLGFSGALMRAAMRIMKSDGFAFSLLTTTSVTPYYEKLGYRVLLRHAFVFERPPDAGTDWRIRAFNKELDAHWVGGLYDEYNNASIGPIVRDEVYWDAQWEFCGEDRGMFLIAEKGGVPSGYIRGGVKRGVLRVLEFAAREEIPSVFAALLRSMMQKRPGSAARILLSTKEQERMSPLPLHLAQPDTDAMILPLDERFQVKAEEVLSQPGSFMYWLSDSF